MRQDSGTMGEFLYLLLMSLLVVVVVVEESMTRIMRSPGEASLTNATCDRSDSPSRSVKVGFNPLI